MDRVVPSPVARLVHMLVGLQRLVLSRVCRLEAYVTSCVAVQYSFFRKYFQSHSNWQRRRFEVSSERLIAAMLDDL